MRRLRPLTFPMLLACSVNVGCSDDPSRAERECSAYRSALTRYTAECAPTALPATADPTSVTCVDDEERALTDAGHPFVPLAECTRLLREHTDPCVDILWRTANATGSQVDEQIDLRLELRHCVLTPVADFEPVDASACERWKLAAELYRMCDPSVPEVTDDATCVSDEALGEDRSVAACARELEQRAYELCTVPLADRERCVSDVLSN